MAFRSSSPEPEDPEMKDFRDPEEAGEGSRLPEELGEGPELVPEEDWEAESGEGADRELGGREDEAFKDAENGEDSPQLTDPNGVSRDMATAALNTGVWQGRPAEGVARTVAGPADCRAMTDAEIMLRVREGDDTGFSFLIEKYRKPIINFMYRMVHNQAVAEELAQEVFLRVYRSRQTYRAEAKFTTWLYRIATNLGVNHARDTKYERAAQTIYLDQPDPETGTTPDVADVRPGAEVELVKDERMRAIRKHVMALPERQRTAVLMHKYQGLDYKEIGAVLKLSESATKSLLFRAYQTLRERLKEFVEQD
ncbi:MAG: sigma-70 family RNA polymerase sigma factor [Acidobacteriaceae bacterium]